MERHLTGHADAARQGVEPVDRRFQIFAPSNDEPKITFLAVGKRGVDGVDSLCAPVFQDFHTTGASILRTAHHGQLALPGYECSEPHGEIPAAHQRLVPAQSEQFSKPDHVHQPLINPAGAVAHRGNFGRCLGTPCADSDPTWQAKLTVAAFACKVVSHRAENHTDSRKDIGQGPGPMPCVMQWPAYICTSQAGTSASDRVSARCCRAYRKKDVTSTRRCS